MCMTEETKLDLFAPPSKPELRERRESRPLKRGDEIGFVCDRPYYRRGHGHGTVRYIFKAGRKACASVIEKFYGIKEGHPNFDKYRRRHVKDRIVVGVRGSGSWWIVVLKPYYTKDYPYEVIHTSARTKY